MKIIKYPTIAKSSEDIKMYFNFMKYIQPIENHLIKSYGSNHLIDHKLFELYRLGNIEKMSVLDIGCGSKKSPDDFIFTRDFEPWLGRALHHIGSKYVGVDIMDNSSELFDSRIVELSKPNSLAEFADNSFDVACAYSFFDSPSLHYPQEAMDNLLPQLERIVRDDGYFIVDSLPYIKIKSKIKK